ncbi:MAG: DUF4149 domain-containing protein [Candidatus Omnitrophica bacterium]|nr:DUF4149 domain-containing protein [Candidatus Omnitrophota bacterium]
MDIAYQTVSFFYHLSLIAWLGGIMTIGFVVAPILFKTLSSRAQAGEVAVRVHRRFAVIELVCMVILLVSSALILRLWENMDTPVVIRYLLIFDMVVLAVFHSAVVTKRLRLIREQIQFDTVTESDPKLLEFKRWHKISVIIHVAILLSGLGALFLS